MSAESDFDPEEEEKRRATIGEQMVNGRMFFQGKELWPFSKAAKMIYDHFTTDDSTIAFCALAFVFILTKRTGTTFKDDAALHLTGQRWDNRAIFRSDVLDLANGLTDEDRASAIRILDDTLKLGLFTAVTAEPRKEKGRKPAQKKTQSGRQTKRGSASRSRRK